MYAYFDKQIAEHRERLATEEVIEPKDFVDAYLLEMTRQQESGEPSYFNDMQLRNVILDLFIAGQETTTNTLTWSVLYILHNLHVQDGMHEELDRVIGSDRMVTMADKPKLPYVNAVINESQRLTNLLPQNLMHRTTRDVVVKGHLIPKDTCILPQISCVLYDEKV
ncbi:Protein CYP-33C1 [Aphelenchoides avenae]|nr:Protein CYP-33C1 [Aphelenchus avenae]